MRLLALPAELYPRVVILFLRRSLAPTKVSISERGWFVNKKFQKI